MFPISKKKGFTKKYILSYRVDQSFALLKVKIYRLKKVIGNISNGWAICLNSFKVEICVSCLLEVEV